MSHKKLSKKDYEFMNSLGASMLQSTPVRIRLIIMFWAFSVSALVIWMSVAEVDELVRGSGEIVPSGENQLIQNLEGGIIESILVNEGDSVVKDQVLIKIKNEKGRASFESNALDIDALKAKIRRLEAEANTQDFILNKEEAKSELMRHEKSLFLSQNQQFKTKQHILVEQLNQKKSELIENKARIKLLNVDLSLIEEEIVMTEPMVKKGVKSKVDFLKLKREHNSIKKEQVAASLSVMRFESAIKELESKIDESRYLYVIAAKEKLNDAISKLHERTSHSNALQDQVSRTLVRSPINGIVQNLFVHTVGGSIRPADDLIEIVPSEDSLIAEVKLKPSDIAFIYPGQHARVKFSAYDYSIYGGLDAKVIDISADSIKDAKDNTYFIVKLRTDKNYLGDEKQSLKIIPGMTVDVDIITGKKSILDYVLKPILKTVEYSFSEN